MKKTVLYFVMLLIMAIFSFVFIALKAFMDIDFTWSQCMMPVWIGMPVITGVKFLFYIMYER